VKGAIQFSKSEGNDQHRGRLWTAASDTKDYDAICRAVKKNSIYDRESTLWVKRASFEAFRTCRAAKKKDLDELVEQNRRYAVDVLGAKIVKDDSHI
jgi:hypothetical protein